MKNKIISTLFFFTFHLFSYAVNQTNNREGVTKMESRGISCTRPTVGFFNGMLNNITEASRNFAELQVNLANYHRIFTKFNMPFNYVLFYNHTEGISGDINEVFKQLNDEENNIVSLRQQTKHDYEEHEKIASDAFKKKMGLLLVGHSQGNFFLNHLYSYCQRYAPHFERDTSRCTAVQIGSPTSIKYGLQYLSSNDVIIKSFFALTGRPFPSNIVIPYNTDDITGHSFIKTYLNKSKPVQKEIMKGMDTILWQFCPFM